MNYVRFWSFLEAVCSEPVPHSLRQQYEHDKDYVVELQDHVGQYSLSPINYAPTLLIIELAEQYATADFSNY